MTLYFPICCPWLGCNRNCRVSVLKGANGHVATCQYIPSTTGYTMADVNWAIEQSCQGKLPLDLNKRPSAQSSQLGGMQVTLTGWRPNWRRVWNSSTKVQPSNGIWHSWNSNMQHLSSVSLRENSSMIRGNTRRVLTKENGILWESSSIWKILLQNNTRNMHPIHFCTEMANDIPHLSRLAGIAGLTLASSCCTERLVKQHKYVLWLS